MTTVARFHPSDEASWDEFVARSANGTIQHTRRFLSYHPEGRWDDRSLMLHRKGRLVGVFPAAAVDRDGTPALVSHPGASYGGVVTSVSAGFSTIQAMLSAVEDHARGDGLGRIEMRHSPAAVRRSEHGQLDFALIHGGYRRAAEELSTFYDLSDFDYVEDFDTFVSSFPPDARRGIRKGARSLTARILTSEELGPFHEVLTATLGDRYGRAPVHTVQEMQALVEMFPRDVFALGVFCEDVLVGGYFVFGLTPTAIHIFYAALDYGYQSHRPLDYALAKLLHLAHQQGRKVLNYGISTEDGGRTVNASLLRFKEGFGGRGSIRTTWVKDL